MIEARVGLIQTDKTVRVCNLFIVNGSSLEDARMSKIIRKEVVDEKTNLYRFYPSPKDLFILKFSEYLGGLPNKGWVGLEYLPDHNIIQITYAGTFWVKGPLKVKRKEIKFPDENILDIKILANKKLKRALLRR